MKGTTNISTTSGGGSTGNNFGTMVDISSYTSSSNMYEFPSDGYAYLVAYNGDTVQLNIYGADGTGAVLQLFAYAPSSKFQSSSCFVRKGMKCWVGDGISVSGSAIRFVSIV